MATVVGSGAHRYELEEGWGRDLPEGIVLGQTAIVTDREDRVYLFNRSLHPLIVLDRDGELVTTWGEGLLTSAHGMFIDRDDNLYLPVMFGHAVLKFDREGNELLRLGTFGVPSDPSWWGDEHHAHQMLEEVILEGTQPPPRDPCLPEYPLHRALREPVAEAHGPFTVPTDAAVAGNGDIFVTDGYGNARVHRFSAAGELLLSWGRPGRTAPGEFHVPHGVWVDADDRVIVGRKLSLKTLELARKGLVRLQECPNSHKRSHDLDVDRDGTVTVEYRRQHRHTLLRKRVRCIASASAPGF